MKSEIQKLNESRSNTEGVYDYLIVCDERNNTPDIIDQNELVVDIYLNRYSNLYTYRETAFPSHLLQRTSLHSHCILQPRRLRKKRRYYMSSESPNTRRHSQTIDPSPKSRFCLGVAVEAFIISQFRFPKKREHQIHILREFPPHPWCRTALPFRFIELSILYRCSKLSAERNLCIIKV